jgi:carbon monoxide dehydrogenase subunit G
MARYVDAIDLPTPIEEAFDYLADFSRTVEWDPGVYEARRLTCGEVRLGSRFEVKVAVLGRRIPLEYRITEFERPSRLVLTGGDSSLRSIDEITLVSRHGGTRVTYEARLELSGIRRLADPALDLLFQRIGRLAVRCLREALTHHGSHESRHADRRSPRAHPLHEPRSGRGSSAKTAKTLSSDPEARYEGPVTIPDVA